MAQKCLYTMSTQKWLRFQAFLVIATDFSILFMRESNSPATSESNDQRGLWEQVGVKIYFLGIMWYVPLSQTIDTSQNFKGRDFSGTRGGILISKVLVPKSLLYNNFFHCKTMCTMKHFLSNFPLWVKIGHLYSVVKSPLLKYSFLSFCF